MNFKEFLNESTIEKFFDGLVDTLNDRMNEKLGIRTIIFEKKPGMRMWTRGDGSKYKEPSTIINSVEGAWVRKNKPEAANKVPEMINDETLNDWAWEQIKAMGAKEGPMIKDEVGSSDYRESLKLGKYILIKNKRTIDYGSSSLLRNVDVWKSQ